MTEKVDVSPLPDPQSVDGYGQQGYDRDDGDQQETGNERDIGTQRSKYQVIDEHYYRMEEEGNANHPEGYGLVPQAEGDGF